MAPIRVTIAQSGFDDAVRLHAAEVIEQADAGASQPARPRHGGNSVSPEWEANCAFLVRKMRCRDFCLGFYGHATRGSHRVTLATVKLIGRGR